MRLDDERAGDGEELKIGDAVKMAGVPIGKVEKIGFEQGKVKVTMKLDREAEVKTDAKATIRFAGLMGQNFVSINLGTPTVPNLAPDSVIQTVEQADLAAIMQKLDHAAAGVEKLAQSFSGDSIQNILGPMTDFLKDFKENKSPKITAILGNLQSVSDRIAKGEGTIGKLLSDDALYKSTLKTVDTLNKTAADAQGLVTDAKGAIGEVKGFMTEAKGSLGDVKLALGDARRALTNASDTMLVAKGTLTDVRADLQAGKGTLGKLLKDETLYKESALTMTNLRQIMEKINKGQGSVGKLVNDDSLIKNAKMTL
ncbi:MAG: MCE family protein, partial [Verrucomicrobia bacterium]|nr:MCE family protein [Verrucomicrobiota bacterium]NDF01066.1 MCE family protein [Verrucomicrobiota bacterium]